MNGKKAIIALTFASGLLLAGCRTGDVFVSPPLSARVIDGRTGTPLDEVTVTMWSTDDPSVRQVSTSDATGTITLPRLVGRLDIAFPFVADPVSPSAMARFEKAGYAPREINSLADKVYFGSARPVELVPLPKAE